MLDLTTKRLPSAGGGRWARTGPLIEIDRWVPGFLGWLRDRLFHVGVAQAVGSAITFFSGRDRGLVLTPRHHERTLYTDREYIYSRDYGPTSRRHDLARRAGMFLRYTT
ncbi:MAG: hypothetical protein ACREQV_23755, partial [Candidatus Binatia bacterium]